MSESETKGVNRKATAQIGRAESVQGFVYFIATKTPRGVQKVKIGFSTNARERMKALSTGSPVKLELLLTVPGTLQDERAFHKRFAAHRMAGEWFWLTKEIWNYIEAEWDRLEDAQRAERAARGEVNPWDITCGLVPTP